MTDFAVSFAVAGVFTFGGRAILRTRRHVQSVGMALLGLLLVCLALTGALVIAQSPAGAWGPVMQDGTWAQVR